MIKLATPVATLQSYDTQNMKGNSVVSGSRSLTSLALRGWRSSYKPLILTCCAIFLVAIVVRTFHWQDNPTPPFHGMTGEYRAYAIALLQGDVKNFLAGPNPPSDANVIKHPPGYPLLMAAVYKLFGFSDNALTVLHILLDALAALLVFLIAYEIFSHTTAAGLPRFGSRFGVAALSGFLVALSPQLAYHSIALIPDPLAAPPLLLSAWLLLRAYKNPRLVTIFASGLMIGVSCWFKANTLLLPLFVCAIMPVLFKRGLRLRFAAALLAGFLLLIAPITIRNAIYFRSFIPVSLGAGLILVDGIGLYDKEQRFGLPDNDYLLSKLEAQAFGRPDYVGVHFGIDGVMRERYRMKRGLAVLQADPVWFSKMMAHNAALMLRLTRVELMRPQAAVRSFLSVPSDAIPSWIVRPGDQASQPIPTDVTVTQLADRRALGIEGFSYNLFLSKPVIVTPNTEYLIRVPLRIEHGAVVIAIVDSQHNTLAWTPVLHPIHWLGLPEPQRPEVNIDLPFVSGKSTSVEIRVTNGARAQGHVAAELGTISAYKLGPASQTWTRYPRSALRLIEKFFITAVMLPFTLLGVILLMRKCRWPELTILLVLPIYYMCAQSPLWTEFRYISPMHYFLFILAAVGFVWSVEILRKAISRVTRNANNLSGAVR